jgi:proton-dependent oligopeptide transporter, POT family
MVKRHWERSQARGTEPSPLIKVAIGCFVGSLANATLLIAKLFPDANGQINLAWVFLYCAIMSFAEMYVLPPASSMVTKTAPAKLASLLMGVWLAAGFPGYLLAGWIGSFWGYVNTYLFFGLMSGIGVLAGVATLVIHSIYFPSTVDLIRSKDHGRKA